MRSYCAMKHRHRQCYQILCKYLKMKFVTTHLYPAHLKWNGRNGRITERVRDINESVILPFRPFHFSPANLDLSLEIYSSLSFYIYLVVLWCIFKSFFQSLFCQHKLITCPKRTEQREWKTLSPCSFCELPVCLKINWQRAFFWFNT